MYLKEWKEQNGIRICINAENHGTRDVIDGPQKVAFAGNSCKGMNKDISTKWIKRKTDTSIKPNEQNEFINEGTEMEIIHNKAIVNTETHDIFLGNSELKLLGTSHHSKDCMEWIYWKNSINIEIYADQILNCAKQEVEVNKKYTVIINTRWASTNCYHWFHECVPRLTCYVKTKNYAQNTQYIWGGNYKPKHYHIETLKSLGIELQNIKYYNGIITCKNLANITMCHRGAFHKKQIEEARKVMQRIRGPKQIKDIQRRIYIKRKTGAARHIVMDNSLENLLKRYGFINIEMENLKLSEQIKLIESASVVIAPYGAGLTHMININKGIKIIEIMPSNSIHPLYWFLAEVIGAEYAMIPSRVINNNQEMCINTQVLEAELNHIGL